MSIGEFLCKIGMHKFKDITEIIDRPGWGSLFNGERVAHYECERCKHVEYPRTMEWDGTDNA